jgi:protein-S-isoprenylcysteine O-methyltransferase Ste14
MQLALVLLFVHVPGLRARWIPAAWPVTALGLAVHAGSFALAAWARGHLGRNWSGAITVKAEHELVRSGPYRLVRHPIYTAMFGMYGGTALVSGELHALLGVALIGVAYARKIPLEEENLRRIFGARYDDYRHASWALIPWVV